MKNTISANSAHIALFVVLGLGVALIGFWMEAPPSKPSLQSCLIFTAVLLSNRRIGVLRALRSIRGWSLILVRPGAFA